MTDGVVVDTEKEGNKTKERQSGERGKQKEIDCSGDGVERGKRKVVLERTMGGKRRKRKQENYNG